MNYQKHYNLLIERARTRILSCYSELHHIIPKCIGGTDEDSNLVRLSPEEHYVAHQLLVKMYPNEPKLVFAAHQMTAEKSRKIYGWLRRKHAKNISGKNNPSARPEIIKKLIEIQNKPERLELNRNYAKSQTEQHKAKLLHAARNKTISHINNIRKAALIQGRKNVISGQWKKCNDLAAISNKQILTCDICGKVGKAAGMRRHHFKNCKKGIKNA